MQQSITLQPIFKVNGTINLPGSKSISNRLLILSAQAKGTTKLINILDSDDIRYMISALNKLGIVTRFFKERRICEIDGLGKYLSSNSSLTLFIGNAGTVMRPLTAALCLQKSYKIILTGESRMKERPIGDLVDALRQGGAKINYLEKEEYPPISIDGGYEGGKIFIKGSISSQFLTSLLIMAPLARYDTHIYIKDNLVSKPYINITLELMKKFGINVEHEDYKYFYIKGNNLYKSPGEFLVEGDASSASYFLAAAAIKGGTVRVTGIDKNSIQGDIKFANVLETMGANIFWGNGYIECTKGKLSSINMDMNHIPDAAMTVAITALFTNDKKTTILRNIYNWRVKETDRLSAMVNELKKVGAIIFEGNDYIEITPPSIFTTAKIETYNDHRMAMCFALIALSNVPITILNPKCINKTFPNFFKSFFKISIFQ